MEKEVPCCNVCLGEPLKSGKECICEGDGSIYGENAGLRKELFKMNKELALLKSELLTDLKEILAKAI